VDTAHRLSTGHLGIDAVVDGLRLGDNVVWQTDDIADFRAMVGHFVAQARAESRRLVYVRFAAHEPLIEDLTGVHVHELDPTPGFESFATAVHRIVTDEGLGAYFVFDSLTDLLDGWGSDLMVMNFFKVTCPYLYELDTVAYFCLLRGQHTFETVAGIRETTQLLLDLHRVDDATYVHPHKVWSRYSPTMFFPHRLGDETAEPVTSSEETSRLFGSLSQQHDPQDRWRAIIESGYRALRGGTSDGGGPGEGGSAEEGPGDGGLDGGRRDAGSEAARAARAEAKATLVRLLLGRGGRMVELAAEHLTLADLLAVADREIGTGYLGGKTVGMLTAGAIAAQHPTLAARLEAHDSFYLGSDLFLTYVIANGWWKDWVAQKDAESYHAVGAALHEKLAHGQFPPVIRERFLRLLEYFGQSPIIVRSSSLLEDNFGNAFAGKYESAFCANQGTPEDRLRAFEDAVRTVYASAMSPQALHYREHRALTDVDEQMAVLVQRVSGDHHGDLFFPHAGGVGNSHNLYVFAPDIDPSAGALRVVVGLGTRAVDHHADDYARTVALDQPRRSTTTLDDAGRFSQRKVDVLSLRENALVTVPLDEVRALPMDWSPFLTPDLAQVRRLRELGRATPTTPVVCDFAGLIDAGLATYMRELLAAVAGAYDYPVDVEFTVNLTADGDFRVCLVQCRPLQTRGIGAAVHVPQVADEDCLLAAEGGFMGGNVRLGIDTVVLVRPDRYLELAQADRYAVARLLGKVNRALAGQMVMMIGPGRWGTSTTDLGVPVHFSDVDNAAVLVEVTDPGLEFSPELSFGSHFFQEIVEQGIFFVALDRLRAGAVFHPERLTGLENVLGEVVGDAELGADRLRGGTLADVVHVVRTPGLELFADVVTQRVVATPSTSPLDDGTGTSRTV